MINKKNRKKPTDWIISDKAETTPEKWIDTLTARKKFESYETAGVDEADFHNIDDKIEVKAVKIPPPFYPDEVDKKSLIRKTNYICPECNEMLYNTKLDGVYFYCPNCKKQFHFRGLNKR